MRPLPPPTYQAEAAAYMVARTANRQRFAALTATLGSANEARAALRTRAAKQRARALAARLGLAYWPAILEPLGVDPRAFVAAEAVLAPLHGLWNPPASHGGWDSQGYHGLSPWAVANSWRLAGCKDSPKFRILVAAFSRKDSITGVTKRHSPSQTMAIIRANRWLTNAMRHSTTEQRPLFSAQALIALGRLSPPLRWAAIHQLPNPTYRFVAHGQPVTPSYSWSDVTAGATVQPLARVQIPIRLRDLDWGAVAALQGQPRWRVAQHRSIPGPVAWWLLHNHRQPAGCPSSPLHFPIGIFNALLAECQLTPTTLQADMGRPLADLARFVGRDLPRLRTLLPPHPANEGPAPELTRAYLHDLGQPLSSLPAGFNTRPWLSLVWASKGQAWGWAQAWPSIQEFLGRPPTSLAEADRVRAQLRYPLQPGDNPAWALAAEEVGLPQHSWQTYRTLWLSPQPNHSNVPGFRPLTTGEYSLTRLHTDDPLLPMLGLATNCCQHLHGAASSCANALWSHPDCAAWVLRKQQHIIAQAMVWRHGATLVLDSIEAVSDQYAEVAAPLFLAAATDCLGRLGIQEVRVGYTSYGITNKIRKLLGGQKANSHLPSIVSYTDATHQWVLASTNVQP